MTRRLLVGGAEIISLPDGSAALGGPPTAGAAVRPGVDWAGYHARHPDGFHGPDHHWRVHNGCYLVRAGGASVLVDLGVGRGPYPRYAGLEGALPRSMERAGVVPEEVDVVFFTHAHPDHVGWSLKPDGTPTFPRARYVLHRADWEEYAVRRSPPPRYVERFVAPLLALGVLELMDGERALAEEVVALHTPGHTPGHMSVLVGRAGDRAVITGDVVVSPFYVSEPEQPFGSDIDPQQGIRTRVALVARAEAEGLRLVGGHMPEPGWGEVVRVNGRRWFRAL
ncbi:MAG: MBL fold metallo-hydrolase [Chloroflexi bacterium]|nr:MBL fold metallo-hydrolase [Chloroflexota bacterium]